MSKARWRRVWECDKSAVLMNYARVHSFRVIVLRVRPRWAVPRKTRRAASGIRLAPCGQECWQSWSKIVTELFVHSWLYPRVRPSAGRLRRSGTDGRTDRRFRFRYRFRCRSRRRVWRFRLVKLIGIDFRPPPFKTPIFVDYIVNVYNTDTRVSRVTANTVIRYCQ